MSKIDEFQQRVAARQAAVEGLRVPLTKFSFDNAQAQSEGWSIYHITNCATDDGPWQIWRIDVGPDVVFGSHEEASRFVASKASAGSDYHTEAIRSLRDYNPAGYAKFCRLTGYEAEAVAGEVTRSRMRM